MFRNIAFSYSEDTLKCIDSIRENVRYKNYHIVVVDNGSPNGTGLELKARFKNDEHVTVILNSKNLGFAKGNNIGYSYARNELKSDFIAVINNDIFIEQPDFIELFIQRYNKKPYHILGPDIVSLADNIIKIRAGKYSLIQILLGVLLKVI